MADHSISVKILGLINLLLVPAVSTDLGNSKPTTKQLMTHFNVSDGEVCGP